MVKKILAVGFFSLVLLGGLFVYQQANFYDGKLHVVFCDVGQGDAIFIRTPKGVNMLVDGGPGDAVLNCLSRFTPFWDRKISLVILTHPHADHLDGLIHVLKNYSVATFASERLANDTLGFSALLNILKEKKVAARYVLASDSFKTKEGVNLKILAPSKQFLDKTSPGGLIGENKEFGSVITLVSYGNTNILLTGDSQVEEIKEAVLGMPLFIEVLQIPHHGSKTGINKEIIKQIKPKLAAISVGRKNRYRHPSTAVLKILREEDVKALRTDEHGDIEIISDGKNWGYR